MERSWMRYDLWVNAVLLDLRLRELASIVARLPPAAPLGGPAAPAAPENDDFLVAYI